MNDDELLQHLGAALNSGAEPIEPSPHSLLLLRAAVQTAIPPTRRASRPWLRRAAVFATALVTVGGGSGVALAATNTPLPIPLRAAARAVGIPVDSAALAATRKAQHDLKAALQHHNTAAVAASATVLQHDFNQLGSSDRSRVTTDVAHELQQADTSGANRGGGHPASGPDSSAGDDHRTTPSRPAPTHTQSTPAGGAHGDDHGHDNNSPHDNARATARPRADETTAAPSTTSTTQPDDHAPPSSDGSGSGRDSSHPQASSSGRGSPDGP